MENLKFMLLPYDPDKALYFGCRFKKLVNSGYMSGGAGYVLSRLVAQTKFDNAFITVIQKPKNNLCGFYSYFT